MTDKELLQQAYGAFYTMPPKKEWVGLTDEEIKNSMQGHNTQVDFARAIEAKLKEKNSG
jgi:hypothetical protein